MRLEGRDYAFPGVYFLTICAMDRKCIFGQVREGKMEENDLGRLARECWLAIPRHFVRLELHEFVIMPNHVHGLIQIRSTPGGPLATPSVTMPSNTTNAGPTPLVGAQHCCALPPLSSDPAVKPGSLGAIVRSFKSIVARHAHDELGWTGPVWQRNYFERVVRDGKEFSNATRYIAENPARWEWDREHREPKPPR